MNTSQSPTAEPPDRATQAIADYMRRVDDGESVDRKQFVEQNPAVADELQRYLDNVALVENLAGPTLADDSSVSPAKENARRETVAGTKGGDSVPEKEVGATSTLTSGKFGRYHVEKTLGEGAMGTVYLARDTELDRRVALKVPKFKDDDTEMMERFYREARAAAGLRHRHICAVHDIGEIDGIKYISIAYIEGRPLSDYVSTEKPPSERNVTVIIRKLALALETAHQDGIIHRDLKPANVMIDKKTEPVIMDFGLARQINKDENERLTQTGTVMGSPAYMSPEQINGDLQRIGTCSDIYSLGVMLYELLTGMLPFEGSIAAVIGQILIKEPEKPSTFRPDLDPRLETICAKMMAKEIDERYTSMKEVAQALTNFLKHKGKAAGLQPGGTLESLRPVELKEVTKESTKGRRTVAPRQANEPIETFPAIDLASGGRQPTVSRKRKSTPNRFNNIPGWAWGIAGAFGTLALVWAITLLVQTPYGTLRVIVNDSNLKVEVGDEMITFTDQLSQQRRMKTGPHRLAVMLGKQKLNLGKTTTVRLNGKDRQVTLSVEGFELSGDEFTISRDGNDVLKISIDSKPVTKTETASGGSNAPGGMTAGQPVVSADDPQNVTDAPVGLDGPTALAKTPFDAKQAKAHQEVWAEYLDVPVEYTNSIGMKFRLIPQGEFMMGSPEEEIAQLVDSSASAHMKGIYSSEGPQHRVRLTRPFFMGSHEVTQEQYQKVMGVNPSNYSPTGRQRERVAGQDTSRYPVELVTWLDSVTFCNRLSTQESLKPCYRLDDGESELISSGTGYRLPTEAEWEYSCRAGTQTRWWFGDDPREMKRYAWYRDNFGRATHPVGKLQSNPFGLYDMYGNVYEYCQDWFGPYNVQVVGKSSIDPRGPLKGLLRIVRGATISFDPTFCSSTHRYGASKQHRNRGTGFRVVRNVPSKGMEQPDAIAGPTAIPKSDVQQVGPAVPAERPQDMAVVPAGTAGSTSLIFDDDFSDPSKSNLPTKVKGNFHQGYENGSYVLDLKPGRETYGNVFMKQNLKNFIFEASFRWKSEPGNSRLAIDFRDSAGPAPDQHSLLTWQIRDTKMTTLFRRRFESSSKGKPEKHLKTEVLIPMVHTSLFRPGLNTIKIKLVGAELEITINGDIFKRLTIGSETYQPGSRDISFWLAKSKPEQQGRFEFDHVRIWRVNSTASAGAQVGPAEPAKNPQNVTVVPAGPTSTSKQVVPSLSLHVRKWPVIEITAGVESAFEVTVDRSKISGPIRLEMTGLPEHMLAVPVTIDKDKSAATVVISSTSEVAAKPVVAKLLAITEKGNPVSSPLRLNVAPPPQVVPFQIPTGGLARLPLLEPTEKTISWRRDGVFAEIKGKGKLKYPRIPVDQFALEVEMEIRNSESMLQWLHNAPADRWRSEINMAHLSPAPEKTSVRILPIRRRGGKFFMPGHCKAPLGKRFVMKITANGKALGIYINGKLVLKQYLAQPDIDLTLSALSDTASATIYRMAYRPLHPRERLDLGEVPETAAAAVKTTVKSVTTGKWFDLISNINPQRDAVDSKWAKSGKTLQLLSGNGHNYLKLPAKPRGSYDVELSFTRHVVPPDHGVAILIPVGNRRTSVAFSGWLGENISGITNIDGLDAGKTNSPCRSLAFRIEPGKRHTAQVRVVVDGTEANIAGTVDGKQLFAWQGEISRLDNTLPLPEGNVLLSCFGNGKTTFHTVRWRRLTGVKLKRTIDENPAATSLQFDGVDSHVVIRKLRFDGKPPWTFEAVVTPQFVNGDGGRMTFLGDFQQGGIGLMMGSGHWSFWICRSTRSRGYAKATSGKLALANQRVHVAGVWDGSEVRLYVNGKLEGRSAAEGRPALSKLPLLIGADPILGINNSTIPQGLFKGLIEEIRISRSVRYKADFVPQDRFKRDRETLVLYHFDEGKGTVLKDASGNGFHGDIVKAKWVVGSAKPKP